ncbi:NAC domain-containing protein 72-like [Asparagus officinalis]|uniref:NAC domain-containing protein 72-like n=1 Tax=Asparagus officinalis TaxID=4686 RepID=UPI00098E5DEB|nr:NAC domain-containing protein 72-like [Asparagus officinalis]
MDELRRKGKEPKMFEAMDAKGPKWPDHPIQNYEKWGADGKWYFFTTRDRKYPNGSRPARHTHDGSGYWKATGSDKLMQCPGNHFALSKSLVYHLGNYPNGTRTNWVMTEIVLTDADKKPVYGFSLCTITRKKEDGRRRRRNNDDEASSSNQVPENLQIVPLEYNQEVNHV